MERLTKKTAGGYVLNMPTDKSISDLEIKFNVYDKLGKYEDSEEQGLLLRLPVAEGTNVFCIGSCGEICYDYGTDCEVCGEHKVVFSKNFDRNMVEQFGKTVFLTQEQAEQALANMKDYIIKEYLMI